MTAAGIHQPHDDLLRLPFVRNGRIENGVADCLGIVLELARRRARAMQDPFERLADLAAAGKAPDSLFPPEWHEQPAGTQPIDDDVLLLPGGREVGVGYVLGGLVYSSHPDHGPYRLPLARLRWDAVWRRA